MILEINAADIFLNILQYTVPALVVFLVTYLTIQKFMEEDLKRRKLEMREKLSDTLTPIKLQAYERFTLLLDRMRPDNLVLRLADPSMSASQFKRLLTESLNEEFNHNVSQQIYISDQAWTLIKAIKENTLNIINGCYQALPLEAKATDLGKAILKELVARNDQTADMAIGFLKKEIDIVF